MSEWWDSLSHLTKIFYLFAIPSTIILFIQSTLTLIGIGISADSDMNFDADMEADVESGMALDVEEDFSLDLDEDGVEDFKNLAGAADFRFVTFRGIIAFLTMFGWGGCWSRGYVYHCSLVLQHLKATI